MAEREAWIDSFNRRVGWQAASRAAGARSGVFGGIASSGGFVTTADALNLQLAKSREEEFNLRFMVTPSTLSPDERMDYERNRRASLMANLNERDATLEAFRLDMTTATRMSNRRLERRPRDAERLNTKLLIAQGKLPAEALDELNMGFADEDELSAIEQGGRFANASLSARGAPSAGRVASVIAQYRGKMAQYRHAGREDLAANERAIAEQSILGIKRQIEDSGYGLNISATNIGLYGQPTPRDSTKALMDVIGGGLSTFRGDDDKGSKFGGGTPSETLTMITQQLQQILNILQ